MARLIDVEPISNGIGQYLAENAYLNDTALDALEMVAKWLDEAPTVDAADLQQNYNCSAKMQRFIPTAKRLPKKTGNYLTLLPGKIMMVLPYSKIHRKFNAVDSQTRNEAKKSAIAATHWMPLPALPEEVETK